MAATRLIEFLEENDLEDGDVIDLYNHCKWGGLHPTLTTRYEPGNNYWIYETYSGESSQPRSSNND